LCLKNRQHPGHQVLLAGYGVAKLAKISRETMPFFHATSRRLLPSILKLGLGAQPTKRSLAECEAGVYLAQDPHVCLALEMDRILSLLGQGRATQITPTPREELAEWVVIVADDARLDPSLLIRDEGVTQDANCWRYTGVIDVTNAAMVDVGALERKWKRVPA
jgi:hypothetical protein